MNKGILEQIKAAGFKTSFTSHPTLSEFTKFVQDITADTEPQKEELRYLIFPAEEKLLNYLRKDHFKSLRKQIQKAAWKKS